MGEPKWDAPTRETLASLALLRNVQLESVLGLLERCEVRRLGEGETLIEAGQENDTLFVVLSGRLRVVLDTEDEAVAELEVGQTVGELSMLDGTPASATVIAIDQARVLAIDPETFWRCVQLSHELAINLLFLLVHRLRSGNASIVKGARARRAIERAALTDVLTGLSNRRWLEERLPRFLARHQWSKQPFSLLLLDIDFFKRINDDFGHAAGDEALRLVGKTITACLRPTDFAARYGGEEMVILLPDTALDGALAAAERVRRVIEQCAPIEFEGRTLRPITVSIGVATREDEDTPATIMGRADAALYRAKAEGRNRVLSS